jgi:hypothetical protein
VDAHIHRNPNPELDDWVHLKLERYGDFSTYTLRLAGVRELIDPYYDHLDFNFKVGCPSDLDCKTPPACAPEIRKKPEINYLAKDYASFRQLILDRLALILPDWRERHVPDIGIALVEALAYAGDYLSYYQDSVATEAYLQTARQRISVRRHARLMDYRMHEGCNARTWVCFNVVGSVQLNPRDVFLAAGSRQKLQPDKPVLKIEELRALKPEAWIAYEPVVADPGRMIEFREAHNTLHLYTWGQRECCIPKGSTRATLLDEWADAGEPSEKEPQENQETRQIVQPPEKDRKRNLHLKQGDILIFEEMRGPKTGDPADADPAHRHAVRLTKAEPGIDPLSNRPILEIAWSAEDAIPFPLCLSALSDAEHGCVYYEDVTVGHGNVVLVDHGLTLDEPETPDPGEVLEKNIQSECACEEQPGDVTLVPARYGPRLRNSPLTFRQPVDFSASARRAMEQDLRKALPQIHLVSRQTIGAGVIETTWDPRLDLLDSRRDDAHFVVEIDNDRCAHLRFGDGICGRMPDAGLQFSAQYRIGNGKTGNIGPETILHLIYREAKPDGINSLRNPLPASGGQNPEPMDDVKLLAPFTFKKQIQRAITADDYARLSERNPKVQKAGAALRWNGSWYEAQVAIDPHGNVEADEGLLKEIAGNLHPYRRIGHDLRIVPARPVWLDIILEICAKPEYQRGHIKAALIERLSNRRLPAGNLGFFHPDELTFGEGICLSRLIAAALEVEGVECVHGIRLQKQFEPPDRELENGLLRLGPLEIARCDNDPNYPEHGKCNLIVRGGR